MKSDQASVVVDADGLPWRPTPFTGVSWKKLRFDKGTGGSAVLLRFDAGARYGSHRHPGGEQYLVLDGTLDDGAQSYGKGAYVFHPPGSVHRPGSSTGCLLFVTLPVPIELLAG